MTKEPEDRRPKEAQHPDGPLMSDGVTRFRQWSDRLAEALVANLNSKTQTPPDPQRQADDKTH